MEPSGVWYDLTWQGRRLPWWMWCKQMDRGRPYAPPLCPENSVARWKGRNEVLGPRDASEAAACASTPPPPTGPLHISTCADHQTLPRGCFDPWAPPQPAHLSEPQPTKCAADGRWDHQPWPHLHPRKPPYRTSEVHKVKNMRVCSTPPLFLPLTLTLTTAAIQDRGADAVPSRGMLHGMPSLPCPRSWALWVLTPGPSP